MKTIKGIKKNEITTAAEIGKHIGEEIEIHGVIYKIRKMSDFSFVLLRMRRDIVQCIYTKERQVISGEGSDDDTNRELSEESAVIVTARVVAEARSRLGYDLQIQKVTVLSEPKEILPIVVNNKLVDTSLENLLNYRPITLRNEKERAIFKLQEGICRGFREFLTQEGFTEIHTPKLVQSGAEGGANIFKLDYFGQQAYLAQSPQFYKQMMVGVFERVFEIAPVFRAEKHDTSRHLNEYTSVDFEMGFIQSFEEIMETETRMLKYTIDFLGQNYEKELESLKVTLPIITEIPQVSFREAKHMIAEAYNRQITDMDDFEPEEEKLLCDLIYQRTGSEFVFVTKYPGKKRPFYAMDSKDNPQETESFDLLFRGLEITTGGKRIHDYEKQLEKMRQRGMNTELFESYLMMHKYGMPPHGGLGLGLERFTCKLLNLNNVRLTTLFPRDIHRLQP